MKKFLAIFLMTAMVAACSENNDSNTDANESNNVSISSQQNYLETPQIDYENQVFEFDAANIDMSCNKDSKMVCALDLALKCTLNPTLDGCNDTQIPQFIFMDDENLGRPTKMTYKIEKLKAINSDTIEVYTQSTCDGNWFCLCQGNVIYVMGMDAEGNWRVKDIYAIAQ